MPGNLRRLNLPTEHNGVDPGAAVAWGYTTSGVDAGQQIVLPDVRRNRGDGATGAGTRVLSLTNAAWLLNPRPKPPRKIQLVAGLWIDHIILGARWLRNCTKPDVRLARSLIGV